MAKYLRLIIIIIIILFPSTTLFAESLKTSHPFSGVTYYYKKLKVPRPLNIHIIEIDPTVSGVKFLASPQSGTAPNESSWKTVRSQLASQHSIDPNAKIAINASFFASDLGYNYNRGIIESGGTVYSPFEDTTRPWPVLHISSSNIPQILRRPSPYVLNYTVYPPVPWSNGISGSEEIVLNGVNNAGKVSYGSPTTLNPRTAMGFKADNTIVIAIIDGRQTGISEGMYSSEIADMFIRMGVTSAVNYDGGGSTTLCFADPTPRVLNVPSDGSERAVGVCWFVFAPDQIEDLGSSFVSADFELGDEGTFAYDPGYSGSTYGIVSSSSTAQAVNTDGYQSSWCQKLVITDDPGISGGWFVRHVSGSSASRSQNIPQPAHGFVGLWAKTSSSNLSVSIAIDNSSDVTADRGIPKPMIADDQWHLYEWNLDDNTQWQGWMSGDGIINTADFTIDSIQFFGGDSNAIIYIDNISTSTKGTLGTAGDLNYDGIVNLADLSIFAASWFTKPDDTSWNANCNLAFPRDINIDFSDFSIFVQNWLESR